MYALNQENIKRRHYDGAVHEERHPARASARHHQADDATDIDPIIPNKPHGQKKSETSAASKSMQDSPAFPTDTIASNSTPMSEGAGIARLPVTSNIKQSFIRSSYDKREEARDSYEKDGAFVHSTITYPNDATFMPKPGAVVDGSRSIQQPGMDEENQLFDSNVPKKTLGTMTKARSTIPTSVDRSMTPQQNEDFHFDENSPAPRLPERIYPGAVAVGNDTAEQDRESVDAPTVYPRSVAPVTAQIVTHNDEDYDALQDMLRKQEEELERVRAEREYLVLAQAATARVLEERLQRQQEELQRQENELQRVNAERQNVTVSQVISTGQEHSMPHHGKAVLFAAVTLSIAVALSFVSLFLRPFLHGWYDYWDFYSSLDITSLAFGFTASTVGTGSAVAVSLMTCKKYSPKYIAILCSLVFLTLVFHLVSLAIYLWESSCFSYYGCYLTLAAILSITAAGLWFVAFISLGMILRSTMKMNVAEKHTNPSERGLASSNDVENIAENEPPPTFDATVQRLEDTLEDADEPIELQS
jgi:hypothetical protein